MINESKENYYFMRSDAAFFTVMYFFKHKAYNDKHTHTKVKNSTLLLKCKF